LNCYDESCKNKDTHSSPQPNCCCPNVENKNIFSPKIIINDNGDNGLLREFDGSLNDTLNITTSFKVVGTANLTIETGDRVLLSATIPWKKTSSSQLLLVQIQRDNNMLYLVEDFDSGVAPGSMITSLNYLDITAPVGLATYTLEIRVSEGLADRQSNSSIIFTASRIAPNV